MSDNKTKHGKQDSSRVSAGEDYEVEYFAKAHGITKAQTLQLIKEHGNDRATLNAAAEKMKAK